MIISYEELKNFKPQKDTYFVFGDPINHSLSPKLHKIFFDAHNIDADYIGVKVTKEELGDALNIVKKYAKGVNLTIPHKKAVIPFLDEIDKGAREIGAVNTLVFSHGKVKGYNTDCFGLTATLQKFGYDMKNKSVLILGNGGVAEAFLYVALGCTDNVTVAGRDIEKVKEFCKNTSAVPTVFSDLKGGKFDIILNGTPVGMSKTADKIPISPDIIKNCEFVFDSIYNPLNTNLTVFSDIYGVKNSNGLYMLIYQGLKAQELWGNNYLNDDADLIFDGLRNEFGAVKKNIVLIGYMGSGKTTALKLIKSLTGKIAVDTDSLIEETCGMSISEMFRKYGEEYFRAEETKIARKVSALNGAVISTGGGIIKNRENMELLKRNGIVFFLNPDIDEIINRISGSKTRPLIKNPDNIKKLYLERLPLYKEYADYIISNNSTKESVGEILEKEKEIF